MISGIFWLNSVNATAKTLGNDDEFSHSIKYALPCTLERNDEDLSSVSE